MSRGRKSKFDFQYDNLKNKQWEAALYVRLSTEDGDKDESTSIESQKHLLDEFLRNNSDIQFYKYYVDDGYSGTDFNRPGFKELFNDMNNYKFNTIIVKDLSRLGRNYIEAGNYIEQIFPLFNIRFISVNDNIDSFLFPESIKNINMPLKNLINDEYCRDISKKVSSAFKTMRKNGLFTVGRPPYGYKRDSNDKHHLIIDEIVAQNVKIIYDLYLKGYGTSRIANYLNSNNIMSPSGYRKYNKKDINKVGYFWCSSTVSKILDNQMYCGDLIQGKSRTVSYKVHKKVKKSVEEWDIIKNTHEPIIDRNTWSKVHEKRIRCAIAVCKEPKEQSIFRGKLKCAECGYALRKLYSKNEIIYNCATYISRSKHACDNHYILERTLKKVVWQAIKYQLKMFVNIEEILKNIKDSKVQNDKTLFYKNNIIKQQVELEKYKKIKVELYEDWKLDNITDGEYRSYLKEYVEKINNLSNNIKYLQQKIKECETNKNKIEDNKWLNAMRKLQNEKSLTYEMVDTLIDNIEINKNKEIIIYFKYKDEYKEALNRVREQKKKLTKKGENYV